MIPIDEIVTILLIFFTYSFAGWVWEMCYEGIMQKKITNRGFLTGPYIPIYGFGGTIVYYSLNFLENHLLWLFFIGMIFATILEYITAVIIENIFKIKLWSYEGYPLNFQGRISFFASMLWGVISVIDVKYSTPFILDKIDLINRDVKLIFVSSISTIFVLDIVFTINSVVNFKERIKNIIEIENKLSLIFNKVQETGSVITNSKFKDLTKLYKHDSLVIKRIIKAFPNMKFKSKHEQNVLNKIIEYNKKNKK